jgi:hypothetical protein
VISTTGTLPPAVADPVAAAFAHTFWWAVGAILLAFIPTLFLQNHAAVAATTGHDGQEESEEAEGAEGADESEGAEQGGAAGGPGAPIAGAILD